MSTNAVGRVITELREKAGLTRAELAAKLGCARMSVHRWEAGERTPALDDIVPIAAALGVSPQTIAKKISELFS